MSAFYRCSILCEHLRNGGAHSSNPLLHVMYDKHAQVSPPSRDINDKLAMTRSRGDLQVKLLEHLKDENYEQVQKRISELETKLSCVNNAIDKTQSEIADTVSRSLQESVRKPHPPRRDITPALSTFNWSHTGTTNKDEFRWHDLNAANVKSRNKHITQWGEMSKYGDDPCVIMMALKNKQLYEAQRKLKKSVTMQR